MVKIVPFLAKLTRGLLIEMEWSFVVQSSILNGILPFKIACKLLNGFCLKNVSFAKKPDGLLVSTMNYVLLEDILKYETRSSN